MPAKPGSTAELNDQDPNHSEKDLQAHQVINNMIAESAEDVGKTRNAFHTLKEEYKTLDDQPRNEDMIEDKDHKVSSPSLLGKSDDQVNNQNNSPNPDEATLNHDDNHVPDECEKESVQHKITNLSSVTQSQTNSFQTQKERPQQTIDKHNNKQGSSTVIQNNDFQNKATHNHNQLKNTLQNKEPNTPPSQAKTSTGPNKEEQKFKHEQDQDKDNSSDSSCQAFSSETRNIPDPQIFIKEGHQNGHFSKHKGGEQDTNGDQIEEGHGQHQEASQEGHDASEVENEEYYS